MILEVDSSTIDKWEFGRTHPKGNNIIKIIEFLGFDPIQKTLTI